jgi:hypothetical protein
MKVRATLCGIVIALTGLSLSAGVDQKLSVRVTPAVAFAPATLVVRTTIQADPDNRTVEIVAESTDFYRSSEMQLDGEQAARVNVFEFRSLPSGAYHVTATLRDSRGQSRASVRSEVNVMQSGGAGH